MIQVERTSSSSSEKSADLCKPIHNKHFVCFTRRQILVGNLMYIEPQQIRLLARVRGPVPIGHRRRLFRRTRDVRAKLGDRLLSRVRA